MGIHGSNCCRIRRSHRWFLLFLCLFGGFPEPSNVYGADSPVSKRVLIISVGSRLAPGFILVDQQLLKALTNIPSVRVQIYGENLDLLRFPSERYRQVFREYLADKYARHPPDLVILVYVGPLGVPGSLLRNLFPGTPVVVAGLTEEEIRPDAFGTLVSGVAQRVNPRAMLEVILRLHPDLRRLVVIGGTAETDQHVLRRVREAAESIGNRIEVVFWDNRTMEELRTAITGMPPRTVIFYARMFRDGAGQAVIASDVGRWLGQWANVPVYVMTDASFGTGAVGGALAGIEAFGRRAGELARQILTGTAPAPLKLEIQSDSVPTFDWRALKRFGIPEGRLPPNSVVRFRPQSLWYEYRWYVVAFLAIIILQGVLIADLLLQRRRRRRVEAQLRENQDLMDLAAGAGELGLWSRDLSSNKVWTNSYLRALFGFTQDEPLVLNDLLARIHPEDRTQVAYDVESAQTDGMPFEGEFRLFLADGRERWIVTRGKAVRDSVGMHRMGVVLDITERKRAEESLRESEERFRMMANSAPVMIWMSDTDRRCTFFNKGWLDFTGRMLEQELGNGWTQGIHADDAERRLQIYSRAFHARQQFSMEYRLRRQDGEYRWILDRAAPRIDIDGKFLGYIGSCIDISDRKRSEAESIKHRDELAHVTRVSTMGELAASLAHELNQPLTAILSNAQAAQRFLSSKSSDVAEVREILDDIVEDDKRAGEVIRRMRALVKKEELEFNALDLSEMIHEILSLVHSDAVLRNVSIRFDVDANLPHTRGDKIQLQQVLLNLLLNAFDAMKDCPIPEREVVLRAGLDESNTMQIAVSDHGIGLTSDKLDQIFQPFYTTKRDGLGMGLSISRSIIEAHGGRLWAQNNQGPGATFSFTLPIVNAEPSRHALRRSAESQGAAK